ncbi:MAG: hypothetical protein IPL27_17700 [Lewinellaceae bacterium]|nr:hypothetical protein [Lewinellaceae bacterium]
MALLYATSTNGAQNCTIQNNTISLNRVYQNTFGIYSNSTHTATSVTTLATATTAAGGNSGLKIYGNAISNVNQGIAIVGPTAAADHNDGLEIGGTAPNANTITNYGTTGTFSGYANVSATVYGILVRNTKNYTVSFNSITSSSSASGVTSGTLRGIFVPAASNQPTGTFTNNINNNTLAITSHVLAGTINGISVETTTSSITSTTNINNNNFTALNHTIAAATGSITAILQAGSSTAGPLNHNINNNTFTNITSSSTGSFTFISSNWTRPTNGVGNINNNSIVTAFNKTGAGGTVTLYFSFGTSGATVNESNTGNNFSNITVTGATTIAGWASTDGGSLIKTVTNNTFSNWIGGTSAITGLDVSFSGSATVSGNLVSSITSAGAITGITSSSGTQTFSQNTVHTLSSTGASAVTGISSTTGGTTQIFSKNKIYNLEANNASGTVSGILVSAGTTTTIQNNIIGDLRTPSANAANPLIGINITGGTTVNVYYNTVYLNATSPAHCSDPAPFPASTTPTLTLKNNIFVNLSTPAGALGFTSAYRRSSTTLTSYGAASNNNLFYAGTPGAANVIFYDGTAGIQTLAAYQAFVSPRDAQSVTENPTFLSTVGSNANFLHIDPSVNTLAESGGMNVSGITDDYDSQTRKGNPGYVGTGTFPDIGADEFSGTNPNPCISNPVTVAVIPPSATYCTGSTAIALTASGADTYAWLPTLGLDVATGAIVNASPASTTIYTATGARTLDGCTGFTTVTITVATPPTISATATDGGIVACGGSSQLQAVVPTTALPNTYSFAGSSGAFTQLVGGTLSTATGDDGTQTSIPIGFTFNYNGTTFTTFSVSTNGALALGATAPGFTNLLASNANVIAPLWDDNDLIGGTIVYATTGVIGSQVLTIEWTNMHVGGTGSNTNPTISMQVLLYEATGEIQFIYGATSAALASTTASIGISGSVGNFLSVTPLSPANTSTVSSVTENTGISSAANFPTGTIYTFTPPAPTVLWSPATFLDATNILNPLASNVTATTIYTVTTTAANTCTASASVTVTVSPDCSGMCANPPQAANDNDAVCSGGNTAGFFRCLAGRS